MELAQHENNFLWRSRTLWRETLIYSNRMTSSQFVSLWCCCVEDKKLFKTFQWWLLLGHPNHQASTFTSILLFERTIATMLYNYGAGERLDLLNSLYIFNACSGFNPIPTRGGGGTLCPPRYTSSNISGTPWATDLKLSDNLNELNWKKKIYFSTASAHPWLP